MASGGAAPATALAFLASMAAALLMLQQPAAAQSCGCAGGECCSRWGYCGTGFSYCGDEKCQQGPCWTPLPISVAGIATPQFFEGIKNGDPSCPGRAFYTWNAFIDAAGSFPRFGRLWQNNDDAKREIAAFFAHVTPETGGMCKIEEDNRSDYCDMSGNYAKYRCVPGKQYYGRGPLQVSWNYNYGQASEEGAVGFNALASPENLAGDARASFKASIWFWMRYARPAMGDGFGATTRAINSRECGGSPEAAKRARYYQDYCRRLGVAPAAGSLTC